mgnify:CR=1 FL=1
MREGVNKVALCLFEHNEKAYHAAVRMMEQYGKAAIVHPKIGRASCRERV